MQNTTYYGLKKPEGFDNIDVADFNDNADVIDAKLKELDNPYVSVKCDTFGYTAPLYDFTINGTAATNTEAASYLAANRNAIIKLTIVNDNVTAEFRYSTTFDGTDFYMAYGFENTIWEMVIEEISGDKYLSTSFYEYENPELKVTSISASSTDAQYPSAKAVYNAISNLSESVDNSKYTKPSAGIPESDLSADVQTKLNSSDSAEITFLCVTVNSMSTMNATGYYLYENEAFVSKTNEQIFGLLENYANLNLKIIVTEAATLTPTDFFEARLDEFGLNSQETVAFILSGNYKDSIYKIYVSPIENAEIVEYAALGSRFITLEYNSTANAIQLNGATQTFTRLKSYLNGSYIVRTMTAAEHIILQPVVVTDSAIRWSAYDGIDTYSLSISSANVVSFEHNLA